MRNPGPWGCSGGRVFDDGVYAGLKQIHVHLFSERNVIWGLQFQYLVADGSAVWSLRHGSAGGEVLKKVSYGFNKFSTYN